MSMSTLYTFSGKVLFPGGAPCLRDIAISIMREGRYAGSAPHFWPVGLHSFVVSDLLPDHLKFHGLNHDDSECVTGDIPSPVKTEVIRSFEDTLLVDMYRSFDVPHPTPEEHVIIKQADTWALQGEIYAGAGTKSLQSCNPRYVPAEKLVQKYLKKYSYADYLEPNGKAVREFIRRFHLYKSMLTVVK